MSLKTVLAEIEKNRPNAEVDVTMGNPDTYRNRLGLKNAATTTLKRLKADYRKELLASSAFIVVTGSGADTFTELASSDTFGCFATDPNDFFKDLTSRITPSLFGREGAKQLFNIAGNILEDKALELDINSYSALSFNDKYNSAVNKAEDFVPLIRNAILDQVGSELVGVNAVYSITEKAIDKKHQELVTPVLLTTSDEKFALALQKDLKKRKESDGTFAGLTDKVFFVIAGKASKGLNSTEGAILVKNVSEESVGEALTSIRNKVL